MPRSNGEEWYDDLDKRNPKKGVKDAPGLRLSNRLSSPSYQADIINNTPSCMLKVVSFSKGSRVKILLDYICRTGEKQAVNDDGLKFENEVMIEASGGQSVAKVYGEWSKDFDRKKRGGREVRHATHILLSAKVGVDDLSVEKLTMAAREFLTDEFSTQGFEYIFVAHKDTKHPHVHVVIKNKNKFTGKKLHLSKDYTFAMKQRWVAAVRGVGIEAAITHKVDRPHDVQAIKKNPEKMKKRTWSEAKMIKAAAVDSEGLDRLKPRNEREKKEIAKIKSMYLDHDIKGLQKRLKRMEQGLVPISSDLVGLLKDVVNDSSKLNLGQRKAMTQKLIELRRSIRNDKTLGAKESRGITKQIRLMSKVVREGSVGDIRKGVRHLSFVLKNHPILQKHVTNLIVASSVSQEDGSFWRARAAFKFGKIADENKMVIASLGEIADEKGRLIVERAVGEQIQALSSINTSGRGSKKSNTFEKK